MKKIMVNLILLIAIAIIGVMVVGILLFNYIPNDITVAKAKTYEVNAETTKVLSDAADSSNLLSQLTGVESNPEDTIKTTIILQTHHVTSSDLALYQQTGAYKKGKADPFADPTPDQMSGGSSSSSGNMGSSGNTASGDGTIFGTSNQK